MQDYTKLDVWKKSHALTLSIYRVTGDFPSHEQYGLTNQMRRAAVSISANIAEGTGRDGPAELHRFLSMASGSASELGALLRIARDLAYLPLPAAEQLSDDLAEVRRMLNSFQQTLRIRRSK